MSANWLRSAATTRASASVPNASMSFATVSSRSTRRAASAIFAPCWPNARAVASPIPDEAPVTITTLSLIGVIYGLRRPAPDPPARLAALDQERSCLPLRRSGRRLIWQGQDEVEAGPTADLALHAHPAAVALHDLLANTQAQANASTAAHGHAVHLVEAVKNVTQFVSGDANACVAHFDAHRRRVRQDVQLNIAARIGEAHGIAEQVVEHLRQPKRVAANDHGRLRQLGAQV